MLAVLAVILVVIPILLATTAFGLLRRWVFTPFNLTGQLFFFAALITLGGCLFHGVFNAGMPYGPQMENPGFRSVLIGTALAILSWVFGYGVNRLIAMFNKKHEKPSNS